MKSLKKMTNQELIGLVTQLRRSERTVRNIHTLLNSLGVPRRVRDDDGPNDDAYVRLIWWLRDAAGVDVATAVRRLGKRGSLMGDHLRKLSTLYESQHGPNVGQQTQPWIIVRWVKENLK